MLNKTFDKKFKSNVVGPYTLDNEFAEKIIEGNRNFDFDSKEYRVQKIFEFEVWEKINRLGFSKNNLKDMDVLEVCAGKGFLAYHLLNKVLPRALTLNEISTFEIQKANQLLETKHNLNDFNWIVCDMFNIDLNKKYDLIIGNSFLHHFPNVPKLFEKFYELLNPGGYFVSLHEPTKLSLVVESGKFWLLPFSIFTPKLMNEVARYFHKGEFSKTDIWLFEPKEIEIIGIKSGFINFRSVPWGLFRPILSHHFRLHPTNKKPELSKLEQDLLKNSIEIDSNLNKLGFQNIFGAFSFSFQKSKFKKINC